jgi:alanyl-tRNA synthetase
MSMDAAAVVRDVAAQFQGRGGGRPELAQAGGLAGTPARVLEFVTASVAARL